MGIILDTTLQVWRHDMGDADLLGWATTVAYLVVAVLCARTALAARHVPDDLRGADRPDAWWTIAAGVFALGLNQQLDLQIIVRELGIRFIAALGMDEHRRWFGRAFVLVLALVLLRVMATAVRRVRGHTRGHRLLLVGLALLACFAVVRAGTYVPGLKQVNVRFGQALHVAFELGGIVILGLSAFRTRQRLVRHQSSSISSA